MSNVTPGAPKKQSAPTKYVILRRLDLDSVIENVGEAWQVVTEGEGDPKAIIRSFIDSNPDRYEELLAGAYQAVPARSWLTGDDVLAPKPKIVF